MQPSGRHGRSLEPDPVAAAILAELAGADGITVHLRGDRRHIQDSDVLRLRETVTTRLNLEMAANAEMVRIACELRPDQATLVPEKASEVTTEGGLDLVGGMEPIAAAIRALSAKGIQVSLFIDPDPVQIDAAVKLGASMVELCTKAFSEACPKSPDLAGPALERELTRVVQASERGKKQSLEDFGRTRPDLSECATDIRHSGNRRTQYRPQYRRKSVTSWNGSGRSGNAASNETELRMTNDESN